MSKIGQAWTRAVGEWLEHIPPFGQLRSNTRRGLVAGATLGVIVGLLAGVARGWYLRNLGGALVGGLSTALLGALVFGLVGALWGRARWQQQGTATLEVELDRNPGRLAPGDEVHGSLHLRAGNTLFFRGGRASLVCRGFYSYDQVDSEHPDEPSFVRETQTYHVSELDVIPPHVLRRGASAHYPFQFVVPGDGLPTHFGHVCAVRWSLHGLVDAPGLDPIEARREVMVEAVPPAIEMAGQSYSTTVHAQPCQLVLTLGEAVCAEGEVVRGRVRLDARDAFGVSEVRAVLLRIEHTPHGRDHNVYISGWDAEAEAFNGHSTPGGHGTTYLWLEDETILSGQATLNAPQTITYPFEFVLPQQVRPSYRAPEGSVTWKVGVVVTRPYEPDIRAFHEVVVHTGMAAVHDLPA
ncbi:MAG: hypothetical protein GX557_14165 [Chloroflexi bacterium]|nr:hypothetical protein [Chloroflexota bacterium]